eukprot:CAMPEP_0172572970 /NCGR_PEP_ID=MMETSP1067-20121228/135950_1 /TAXON_ID=265564 ORGANISM="Thalassiosira punctigera, Strain Tpunct2005C2" /NCGR_SAMPLE_ID=MMETSP1067 /ASSEMBLY_ACC=CAM_ASM_000444 /LENGTH=186 /DNA_ID=CAMNT_0013365561 /DNA_START=148 /DNA_END=708 /DNA_ORIENTATION=-
MVNAVAIQQAAPAPPTKAVDSDDAAAKRCSKFQRQLDRAVHERGNPVPIALRFFTMKAKEERARRDAESRRRANENMSEAHRHFRRLTIEKDEQNGGVEVTMSEAGSPGTKRARGEVIERGDTVDTQDEGPSTLSQADHREGRAERRGRGDDERGGIARDEEGAGGGHREGRHGGHAGRPPRGVII